MAKESFKISIEADPKSIPAIRKLVSGALKDLEITANASKIRANIAKEMQKPFFVNIMPSQKSIRTIEGLFKNRNVKIDFKLTADKLKAIKDVLNDSDAGFKSLNTSFNRLAANINQTMPGIVGQFKQLNTQISQLNNAIKAAPIAKAGGTGGNSSGTNRAAAAASSSAAATVALNNVTAASNNATAATQTLNKTVATAAATQATFAGRIAITTQRLAAYAIVSPLIYRLVGAFGDSVTAILEVDKNLNRLTQIMNGNADAANRVTDAILKFGTAYGQSGRQVLDVVDTLAQAGNQFSSETGLINAAEAIAKTNLAATFGGIEDTTSGVIAVLNQFNLTGLETARVLDVANKVAKDFAVEAGDIFKAVQSGGGAFSLAGGSFEEFTALAGTFRQLTRLSAPQIGTAINSISVRSLRPEVIALTERLTDGSIRDADGNLKNITDRLIEIANATKGLTNEQLNPIIEQISELRQAKFLTPIIRDIQRGSDSVLLQQLKSAKESAGSLSQDAIKGLERLDVQLASIGARFDELFKKISQDPAFRSLVNDVVVLSKAFVDLIDVISPVLPLLLKFGVLKGLFSFLPNIKNLGGLAGGGGASPGQAVGPAGRGPFGNLNVLFPQKAAAQAVGKAVAQNVLPIVKQQNQFIPFANKGVNVTPNKSFSARGIQRALQTNVSPFALQQAGFISPSARSQQRFNVNPAAAARDFSRPVGTGGIDINNVIRGNRSGTIRSLNQVVIPRADISGTQQKFLKKFQDLTKERQTLERKIDTIAIGGASSVTKSAGIIKQLDAVKLKIKELGREYGKFLATNEVALRGGVGPRSFGLGAGIARTTDTINLLDPRGVAQGPRGSGGPGNFANRSRDTFPFANVPIPTGNTALFEGLDDSIRGSAGVLSTATALRAAGINAPGTRRGSRGRFSRLRQQLRVRGQLFSRAVGPGFGEAAGLAGVIGLSQSQGLISDEESLIANGQLSKNFAQIQRANINRRTGTGALSGATTGGLIGLQLGSIIPGIGNLAGFGIGAAAGGLIGAATGRNAAQEQETRNLLNAAGITNDPRLRQRGLNAFNAQINAPGIVERAERLGSSLSLGNLGANLLTAGTFTPVTKLNAGLRNTFNARSSVANLQESLASPEGQAIQQQTLVEIQRLAKNTDPRRGNVLGQIRERFIQEGVDNGGNRQFLTQLFGEITRDFGLEELNKLVNKSANEFAELQTETNRVRKALNEYQSGIIEFTSKFNLATEAITRGTNLRQNNIENTSRRVGILTGAGGPATIGGSALQVIQDDIRKVLTSAVDSISPRQFDSLVGSGAISSNEANVLADLGSLEVGLRNLNTNVIRSLANDTFPATLTAEALPQLFGTFVGDLLARQNIDLKTTEGRGFQQQLVDALTNSAKQDGALEKFNTNPEAFIRSVLGDFNVGDLIQSRLGASFNDLNTRIQESAQAFDIFSDIQKRVNEISELRVSSRVDAINNASQFGFINNRQKIGQLTNLATTGPLSTANARLQNASARIINGQNRLNTVTNPYAQEFLRQSISKAQADYAQALSDGKRGIEILAEAARTAGEELDKINQGRSTVASTSLIDRNRQLVATRQFAGIAGGGSVLDQVLRNTGVNSVPDFNRLGDKERNKVIAAINATGLPNNPDFLNNATGFGGFGAARLPGTTSSFDERAELIRNIAGASVYQRAGFDSTNKDAGELARAQTTLLETISRNSAAEITTLTQINTNLIDSVAKMTGVWEKQIQDLKTSLVNKDAGLHQGITGLNETVATLQQSGIKLSFDGKVVVEGLEGSGPKAVAMQQAAIQVLEKFVAALDRSNPTEASLAEKFTKAINQIKSNKALASGVRTQSVITESTA